MGSSISDDLREANPIGTRLLVEVEISEEAGYDKLLACLLAANVAPKFKELTGTELIKIYLKNTETVDGSTISLERMLEMCLEKIKRGER